MGVFYRLSRLTINVKTSFVSVLKIVPSCSSCYQTIPGEGLCTSTTCAKCKKWYEEIGCPDHEDHKRKEQCTGMQPPCTKKWDCPTGWYCYLFFYEKCTDTFKTQRVNIKDGKEDLSQTVKGLFKTAGFLPQSEFASMRLRHFAEGYESIKKMWLGHVKGRSLRADWPVTRRRLPPALEHQVSNGLAPPSAEVLPWLPTAGVLMLVAFLVYQFVIRRLVSSKPKARDSVRDLEAGLLQDDPCL